MADKKISQLTALSAANVASATDVLAIVDTSATETKKITAKDLIDGALNGGTANGVLYLNGSKVATSGSALVFDGTNLGVGVTPSYKLDVLGSGAFAAFRINNATAGKSGMIFQSNGATAGIIGLTGFWKGDSSTNFALVAETGFDLRFYTNGSATEKAVIDTSGNLGLGVTPSLWQTGAKAVEIGGSGYLAFTGSTNGGYLYSNAYLAAGGNTYKAAGYAAAYGLGPSGQHQWFIAPSWNGTGSNAISFTQAMTLDASGNLLVGTTTPALASTVRAVFNDPQAGGIELVANNSGGVAIVPTSGGGVEFVTFSGAIGSESYTERARITSGGDMEFKNSSGTSVSFIGVSSTAAQFGNRQNDATIFYTNNTAVGRFTAGGDLLVGTATTRGKFTVEASGGVLGLINTNATVASGTRYHAVWYENGVEKGSVTSDGTNTAYNTSSDRRLKENISLADDAGAIIDAIQVVKHDWKNGGHTRFGVIAQDLNSVAPEAVNAGDDGEEIQKTWGVDYSKLVPMLVKEIQSLRSRVAALEAK